MSRRTSTLAVVAALLASLLTAGCGGGDTPAAPKDRTGPRTVTEPFPGLGRPRCSAGGLSADLAAQELPSPVADMRARIARAAVDCDYDALERLGRARGESFEFSYGAARSAARYWRTLEASGEPVMAALVKVLSLPFARARSGVYVWPSAHREHPNEADWKALRRLYSPAEIERMREAGTGYLGWRVGIAGDGDWQFFIAGD